MAKKYKYTKEEKEIIDYIEKWNPKSIPNLKKEIAKYQEAAKKQYSKKRAISIRLLEYDIDKLKAKSLQEWIPYQTLIAWVVHKYANS
jgi:predicted DNA binding CopG/RHH family protein